MRTLIKLIVILLLIAFAFWLGTVANDKEKLQEDLLRLHVIANSDSEEDQKIKLQVRDAIVQRLEAVMPDLTDMESAKAYLQENLEELQQVANDVLEAAGNQCRAVVTLGKSAFPTRDLYLTGWDLPVTQSDNRLGRGEELVVRCISQSLRQRYLR